MRQENTGITMADCWNDSIKPDLFSGFAEKPIKDFYLRKEIVVNAIAFIPMCHRFSVEDTTCFSPFNLVCQTFSVDHTGKT